MITRGAPAAQDARYQVRTNRPAGSRPAGFSRPCERLRGKPMWTLTHPKNWPCGYAVDMLRKTGHETLPSKRRRPV